jgi:hypothetical protein
MLFLKSPARRPLRRHLLELSINGERMLSTTP